MIMNCLEMFCLSIVNKLSAIRAVMTLFLHFLIGEFCGYKAGDSLSIRKPLLVDINESLLP